jgi:hypothetical protein
MEQDLRREQPRRSLAGLLLIWAFMAAAILYARPAASHDLPEGGVAVLAVPN